MGIKGKMEHNLREIHGVWDPSKLASTALFGTAIYTLSISTQFCSIHLAMLYGTVLLQ